MANLEEQSASLLTGAHKACPVCGSMDVHLRFAIMNVPVLKCAACEHSYANYRGDERHVATSFGDDYFFGGGAGYLDYLSEADLLRRQGKRYGLLLKEYLPQNSTVLDVGSAAGFIAAGVQDCGFQVTALEPNKTMASYAAKTLGLSVLNIPLDALDSARKYDAITMIQIVAHLADPRKALMAAAKATRPGGYWLIEGWNTDSFVARIRRDRWHVLNPPSVLQYFSTQSLDTLVANCGLVRVRKGRPNKQITAAHATGLLTHLSHTSQLMKLALAVAKHIPPKVSFPYPGDDIEWILYQNKQ